jgi:hypothetical protein
MPIATEQTQEKQRVSLLLDPTIVFQAKEQVMKERRASKSGSNLSDLVERALETYLRQATK